MKIVFLYLLFLLSTVLFSPRPTFAQGACNCDSSHGVCNMSCCTPAGGCNYTNSDSCCRRTCNSSYVCKTVSGEGSDQCNGENTSCGTPPTSTPVAVPTSTPAPACQTSVWNESCGWSGLNWCGLGACNTGWVSGPSVSLSCPSNQILRNDGTYCSRWDGKKSFSGTVSCISSASCVTPTPTRTPTLAATRTPTPTATRTPVPGVPTATRTPTPTATRTPVPGVPTATRTPTPTATRTPVPGAPTATRTIAPTPTNTPGPGYPLCDASCGVCGVKVSASSCYVDWGNSVYGLNCCHMECLNSPLVCMYVDGGGSWNCAACAPSATPIPDSACEPVANPAGLVCDVAGNRISWNPVAGADYYPLRVDDSPSSFNSACTPTNPGDVCEDVSTTYKYYTFEPGGTYDIWVHAISACDGSWGVGAINRITCVGPNGPPSMARLTVANSVGMTIGTE
ncbi:MAG: hypothetical protein WC841_02535 [Candidatus Shapirobacteria bacterium]|jgi:hypothetical protein